MRTITWLSTLFLGALIAGCGGEADEMDIDMLPSDAAIPPDAAPPLVCDPDLRHANRVGPFTCENEPDSVTLTLRGRAYDIFRFEASHPLATADTAFPCAASQGDGFQAPPGATEACSRAGVRPWHTVKWADADAACQAIGWRICTGEELIQACGGDEDRAYTYGSTFEPGRCNLREQFRPEGGSTASESPTGYFEDCISPEGVVDLSGNLWEWNSDRSDMDSRARFYQGAGWRTIPERHRDSDLRCTAQTALPRLTAPTFANSDVGFRCCRTQ